MNLSWILAVHTWYLLKGPICRLIRFPSYLEFKPTSKLFYPTCLVEEFAQSNLLVSSQMFALFSPPVSSMPFAQFGLAISLPTSTIPDLSSPWRGSTFPSFSTFWLMASLGVLSSFWTKFALRALSLFCLMIWSAHPDLPWLLLTFMELLDLTLCWSRSAILDLKPLRLWFRHPCDPYLEQKFAFRGDPPFWRLLVFPGPSSH